MLGICQWAPLTLHVADLSASSQRSAVVRGTMSRFGILFVHCFRFFSRFPQSGWLIFVIIEFPPFFVFPEKEMGFYRPLAPFFLSTRNISWVLLFTTRPSARFPSSNTCSLQQGVAAALKDSPRDARCLLWLTALHLLVFGVFPSRVLEIAENLGKSDADVESRGRRRCLDFLRWPEEWLSSESQAGRRLSASAELRDATTRMFMSALQDARLLPSEKGGGGWAPPLRVHHALIPSVTEAAAARAGGMAPEPSVLEGPGLVLSLNWLTFCCRSGKGKEKGVRKVALACCRRFQLTRPDHPALLEHNLLEHHAPKVRSLDSVYHEISSAFDAKGAAAAAVVDRGESIHVEDFGDGDLTPSPGRLEAVYAFLRFIEAREMDKDEGDVAAPKKSPAASSVGEKNSSKPAAAEAEAGAKAAKEKEREATSSVLREAIVSLWVKNPSTNATGRQVSATARWLRSGDGETYRRAVERAKASLFKWVDGEDGGNAINSEEHIPSRNEDPCSDDDIGAERQLSVIFFALWILGGPATAVGALDHILSAESFSTMSPVRRRQLWLHRIEAAVVLSEKDVSLYLCFFLI